MVAGICFDDVSVTAERRGVQPTYNIIRNQVPVSLKYFEGHTHLITNDVVGGLDAPALCRCRYIVKADARDHLRQADPAKPRVRAGSRLSFL